MVAGDNTTQFKFIGMHNDNGIWDHFHRMLQLVLKKSYVIDVDQYFTICGSEFRTHNTGTGAKPNLTRSGKSPQKSPFVHFAFSAEPESDFTEIRCSRGWQSLNRLKANSLVVMAWLILAKHRYPSEVIVESTAPKWAWDEALKLAEASGYKQGLGIPFAFEPVPDVVMSIGAPAHMDFRA